MTFISLKILPGSNICCKKHNFTSFFISVLLFAKSSTVKIFHSVDLLFLRIPTLFPISCICRNFSSHTWSLANISATETLFANIFVTETLFHWWSLFCHSGFVSDAGKILHMQRFVQRCPRKTMRQVFSGKDHKLTEKKQFQSNFEREAPEKGEESR